MARINFEVEDSLHKAIKSVALSHNKSIKEYILTFIRQDLAKYLDDKPLTETEEDQALVPYISKILADIDNGKEKTYGYNEFAQLKKRK